MSRNTTLRDFLRARRALVTPEEAGMRPGIGRRRVPGLRREELADLAGISMDYYVRLEQGRCPNVSDAVLDALARALRLTPIERSYLHAIARPPAPARDSVARSPTLNSAFALLLRAVPTPALVVGRCQQLLGVNSAAADLFVGVDDTGNYARWLVTDPRSRAVCADWTLAAREVAATLRHEAATRPDDDALAALVEELTTADVGFAEIWEQHCVDVGGGGPRRYLHPTAGEVALARTRLVVRGDHDQTLLVDGPPAELRASAMDGTGLLAPVVAPSVRTAA